MSPNLKKEKKKDSHLVHQVRTKKEHLATIT